MLSYNMSRILLQFCHSHVYQDYLDLLKLAILLYNSLKSVHLSIFSTNNIENNGQKHCAYRVTVVVFQPNDPNIHILNTPVPTFQPTIKFCRNLRYIVKFKIGYTFRFIMLKLHGKN